MKYKLRNLLIDRTDLVERGANQEAHIMLYKAHQKPIKVEDEDPEDPEETEEEETEEETPPYQPAILSSKQAMTQQSSEGPAPEEKRPRYIETSRDKDKIGQLLETDKKKKRSIAEDQEMVAKRYRVDHSLTPEKAEQILRDGQVKGKPLTDAQRAFFEARASGKPMRKHYGPGDHASGSSQDVHGGGSSNKSDSTDAHGKSRTERLQRIAEEAVKDWPEEVKELIEAVPARYYLEGGMFHGGSREPDDMAHSIAEATIRQLGGPAGAKVEEWLPDGTVALDVYGAYGDYFRVQPISASGNRNGPSFDVAYESFSAEAEQPFRPAPVTTTRSLSDIAREIRRDWGSKVNFAAQPYLDAMSSLDSITDNYWHDSGESIVNYFLSNASTWRGETAKRIKAELRAMVKGAQTKPRPLRNPGTDSSRVAWRERLAQTTGTRTNAVPESLVRFLDNHWERLSEDRRIALLGEAAKGSRGAWQ